MALLASAGGSSRTGLPPQAPGTTPPGLGKVNGGPRAGPGAIQWARTARPARVAGRRPCAPPRSPAMNRMGLLFLAACLLQAPHPAAARAADPERAERHLLYVAAPGIRDY